MTPKEKMKELQELQSFLTKLLSMTKLKDRSTNVSISIEDGKPKYKAEIHKEGSSWQTEISASENTLEKCKIRLEREIKMYNWIKFLERTQSEYKYTPWFCFRKRRKLRNIIDTTIVTIFQKTQ